jgi:hypothetical protein
VASTVEAAKLQRNSAPSRFRDCQTWYQWDQVARHSKSQPDSLPAAFSCVLSPSEPPCVLTQAGWFPLLRVPSSGTVSSTPNGAEPCLLLLPMGLRPSSSAAFPSYGRQWRPLLRLPNCRAIPLRRVSGTTRHGIVSTPTTRRFGLAYASHVDPLSSSLVVAYIVFVLLSII